MNRLPIILSFVLLSGCFTPGNNQGKKESRRPNIILIVADDLGYGNLSCYNPAARIATPHIDKMAGEGIRFTRFYAGSTVCAPSRAALMTGFHMGHAYLRGNSREALRPQDTTLAQCLQQGGYVTGMFGKWGLGEAGSTGMPHLKGFDEFFGYLNQRHAHHYFTDHLYEIKGRELKKVKTDSTLYSQELIMERARAFIHTNKENPFFLYLPVTLPHAELLVPDTLLQEFLNADGSSKLGPETPFYQKGRSYRTQLKPHAAFAAMITRLDRDVGSLLSLLKELGLDEDTYVFFTSDNGPHKEGGADPEY
ncbi:MAG TPA: sulfatase-like hydrolase/transferase, partial [Anseongella sp.]|nr:sulfatase-like hydrolase/transferase [Anseongella sp.]